MTPSVPPVTKPLHRSKNHQRFSHTMAKAKEGTKGEEVQDSGPTDRHHNQHHQRLRQHQRLQYHHRPLHLRHILCPRHSHQLAFQHSHKAPGHNLRYHHTTTIIHIQVTTTKPISTITTEVVIKATEVVEVEEVTEVAGADMEVPIDQGAASSVKTTLNTSTDQLNVQPTLHQQPGEID